MAIILAVLYFGLIELLMIDSARELNAARRFRAQVVAQTLAENAAEGAALMIADENVPPGDFKATSEDGTMDGSASRFKGEAGGMVFELKGTGVSAGLASTTAQVTIRGRINGKKLVIDYADHNIK